MDLKNKKNFTNQKSNELRISVSVGILKQLVRYLNYLNVDVDKIFWSVGVDPDILSSPDERIQYETYVAIEETAANITKDPYFGLHMVEFFEAGNWTILGYMMANCKTLGEAFEKSGRYLNIIGNLIQTNIQIKYKRIKVILSTPPYTLELSSHCFESALSSTIRMARYLSGNNINPLEVGFTSPYPDSMDEYTRVFRCPVLFKQKDCYIILDWNFINTPVLLPNYNLLEHFENYAKEYLALIEVNDTTGEVIKQILSNLDSKHLSEKNIAKAMSMSTRTLQVYLKREGKKFNEILQEVRERLAKKYLCEKYTVEEITYLLGFSDPSVFRRSFKKWTGCTPKEYRDSADQLLSN